jgi:hypothetical protein
MGGARWGWVQGSGAAGAPARRRPAGGGARRGGRGGHESQAGKVRRAKAGALTGEHGGLDDVQRVGDGGGHQAGDHAAHEVGGQAVAPIGRPHHQPLGLVVGGALAGGEDGCADEGGRRALPEAGHAVLLYHRAAGRGGTDSDSVRANPNSAYPISCLAISGLRWRGGGELAVGEHGGGAWLGVVVVGWVRGCAGQCVAAAGRLWQRRRRCRPAGPAVRRPNPPRPPAAQRRSAGPRTG